MQAGRSETKVLQDNLPPLPVTVVKIEPCEAAESGLDVGTYLEGTDLDLDGAQVRIPTHVKFY